MGDVPTNCWSQELSYATMRNVHCMKLGGPTLRGMVLFLALDAAIPVIMQHQSDLP